MGGKFSTTGHRIRELRTEAGLTQLQLGEIFKKGDSTVRMWELDKSTPTPRTIGDIADYFNVSVDYLLGKTSYKTISEEWKEFKTNHPSSKNIYEEWSQYWFDSHKDDDFDVDVWLIEGLTQLGFSNFSEAKLEKLLEIIEDEGNRMGMYIPDDDDFGEVK